MCRGASFKCIGLIHPLSTLYSHALDHYCTTNGLGSMVIFVVNFLKPVCGVCSLFPPIFGYTYQFS